jgi:PPOX class probable FMN-dependent enzyme
MGNRDPHLIESVEELRGIVGEPIEQVPLKLWTRLEAEAIDYIAASPFLILSTADAQGRQDASPKGDLPGFAEVEDEGTLLIPDRPGNKLVMGLQNILANPRVGLLFMVPGTPETLRVNGSAELTRDPAVLERLSARGKPAVLAVRVRVEECFFHCAKAFLRSSLWKPESWPERRKISFGNMIAKRMGADGQVAGAIDEMVEQDNRENL